MRTLFRELVLARLTTELGKPAEVIGELDDHTIVLWDRGPVDAGSPWRRVEFCRIEILADDAIRVFFYDESAWYAQLVFRSVERAVAWAKDKWPGGPNNLMMGLYDGS